MPHEDICDDSDVDGDFRTVGDPPALYLFAVLYLCV